MPVGNFDAAAQPKQKSPGWPASGFRARSPRDIYGTFCPGPICPGKAGRRRECYRSTGSARPKQAAGSRLLRACTGLQLSAEGAACRTRWGAGDSFVEAAGWRGKSVFGAFWGLGQKALRRGTRVLIVRKVIAPQPCAKVRLPATGSALLPDAPILRGEKPICAQPASARPHFGAFAQISGGEKVKNL